MGKTEKYTDISELPYTQYSQLGARGYRNYGIELSYDNFGTLIKASFDGEKIGKKIPYTLSAKEVVLTSDDIEKILNRINEKEGRVDQEFNRISELYEEEKRIISDNREDYDVLSSVKEEEKDDMERMENAYEAMKEGTNITTNLEEAMPFLDIEGFIKQYALVKELGSDIRYYSGMGDTYRSYPLDEGIHILNEMNSEFCVAFEERGLIGRENSPIQIENQKLNDSDFIFLLKEGENILEEYCSKGRVVAINYLEENYQNNIQDIAGDIKGYSDAMRNALSAEIDNVSKDDKTFSH